jgi:hypothetical protein
LEDTLRELFTTDDNKNVQWKKKEEILKQLEPSAEFFVNFSDMKRASAATLHKIILNLLERLKNLNPVRIL